MQMRLSVAIPILILVAGCSEKIEAQEGEAPAAEAAADKPTSDVSDNMGDKKRAGTEEVDIELRRPVGLD